MADETKTKIKAAADALKAAMDARTGPEYVIREICMPHLRDAFDDLTVVVVGRRS